MEPTIETTQTTRQHGGKREGAGRKSRFGVPMVQKTIRLPQEQIDQLVDEFGTLQHALEVLVTSHILNLP